MKKLGIFLILCLVVLVVMPITAHGQSSKAECKGDLYDGKNLKIFGFPSGFDQGIQKRIYMKVEVCIQQGWELKSPFGNVQWVLTKK